MRAAMYKGASQNLQTRLDRKQITDSAAAAGRSNVLTKAQQRENFRRVIAKIDHEIAMLPKKSPKRKELGARKLYLQRAREIEKKNGIASGAPNAKRVADIFVALIFDLLPQDGKRLWDRALAQEAAERHETLASLEPAATTEKTTDHEITTRSEAERQACTEDKR